MVKIFDQSGKLCRRTGTVGLGDKRDSGDGQVAGGPVENDGGFGDAGRMNLDGHVDLHGITLPAAGLGGIGPDLRTDLEQFQDSEFHLREFFADLNQPPPGDRNHFGAGGGFDDALRDANLGEWEDIPKDMVLPEQPAGPLLKPLCVELRLVPTMGPSRMCSRIALGMVQSLADSQPVGWTAYLENCWVDPGKICIGFTLLVIGMLGDPR